VAIAIALALPLNLVIAAIIWHLSDSASDAQRMDLMYSARSVAAAAGAKLDKYMAMAQALARSPAIVKDNIDDFEAEARRAFASDPDALVIVADYGGRELLNTARRLGKPGPLRDPIGLDTEERAFESNKTVISDAHLDAGSQQWVVHIEVPIFKDGEPFRTLVAAVKAQSFFRLLNDQHLPRDWIAAILDSQGRFIARATERDDDERYIGQLSSESWRKLKDRDGIFEVLASEGDRVIAAKTHSTLSGWQIAVALKKAAMNAATWRAVRWALILGGGFSIMSLLLAAIIARSITGPIDGLRTKAATLLEGRFRGLPAVGPPEVRELWRALQQSAADRDRSDRALRDSELRLRRASQAAGFGVFECDPHTRSVVWSAQRSKIAGMGDTDRVLPLESVIRTIHPEDRERAVAEIEKVMRRPGPFELEFRCLKPDGGSGWLLDRGEAIGPVNPASGLVSKVTGTVIDITERKVREQTIEILMREVNHRSKNLLSIVQAVARQTLAAKPEDFLGRFGMRVEALAANQDLLVKNAWKGVDLYELVRSQLAPFDDLTGTRIGLQGPPLFVSAPAAQAIGMAVHELATNAGKYGALLGTDGYVDIAWCVQHHEGEKIFFIAWRERCAHPITAPSRNGFGSTVIGDLVKRSLGAQVELDYPSTGLTWQLRCPATEVLEG
jgi:PAS domain S-box-containing protein